jgi:hypothetical protein
VLDSGTTYAYLPEQAFVAFKDAVSHEMIYLQPAVYFLNVFYRFVGSLFFHSYASIIWNIFFCLLAFANYIKKMESF